MKKEFFLAAFFFTVISLIFFYPVFKGFIPFPGDLLMGNYTPYNTYSFFGYAPGGFPHKAQNFDVIKLLYPLKELAIDAFKDGQFPLWNPYNFSGNPHLASLQAGAFYPINIIFFLFSFTTAWFFYIIIQPILSGIFTYFLLREFNLSKKSSLFGGLTFSFSSYFIVWMEYGNMLHTIIWLPFLMWLSLKNIQKPTLIKSLLMIFVLSFSILAGYIQTTLYLYIFTFAFILFNVIHTNKEKLFNNVLIFLPIFILPVLLSAVQLLPLIELFLNSSRTSYASSAFINMLIPQFHLATLFAPDFFGNPVTRNYWLTGTYIERVSYIGIMPLFFALYSLLQKRIPMVWFFAVSLIITYLLTFDTFVARIIYSLNIPVISTAVPSRIMYIFVFCASVLAAFGLNSFEKNKNKKTFIKSALILGVVFALLWIFVLTAPFVFKNLSWVQNLSITKRNLILPTAFLSISLLVLISSFKLKISKIVLFALIALITIFDLFYFFQKITPFSSVETVYPRTEILSYLKQIQGIDRYWGYGSAYIEPNFEIHEKIFSPDGYDALHIKRYGELVSSSQNGRIENVRRSEAFVAAGYGQSDLRENLYRQKILNLLGIKYVLHKINPEIISGPDYQTFDPKIYELIWQKGDWQIYKNKEVLPRVFLASDYIVENNSEKIIEKIFDKEFPIREKIILEEPLMPEIKLGEDNKVQVTVKNYTPNRVTLQTKSDANMLLFFSDNYFPGWKASVDGKNGKIYRANYTFRAVLVQKGTHEVVFWYYPSSFDWGLKISIATFFVLTLIFCFKNLIKSIFVRKTQISKHE